MEGNWIEKAVLAMGDVVDVMLEDEVERRERGAS